MWVCMYRVVNVRPAVLFCICLSLTLVHPTGRGTSCFCQQGRLRSALLPLLWGWNKGEGYPKTEEEKERIDKAISWFGKGIKGIQLNWAWQRGGNQTWAHLLSWFLLQLYKLFIISLEKILFPISCSVLLYFLVNSVNAALFTFF